MTGADGCEQEGELPPAGSRSGCGAQSVLPYLTRTLQARPASAPEPRARRTTEDQLAFDERPGWLA